MPRHALQSLGVSLPGAVRENGTVVMASLTSSLASPKLSCLALPSMGHTVIKVFTA